MSWPRSPDWLLELQGRFGTLLRTPLDGSGGSLRADTAAYDTELVDAARPSDELSSAEHLAVYHRQYWFRLFTVLQGLYPLTARLVGYFRFNQLATRHLLQRPPRGFDIDDIGEHFERSLAEQLPQGGSLATDARGSVEVAAVVEAAKLDAAFHRVLRAPACEPLRPGPADMARFGDSCLRLSPAVALLRERWPLAELRLRLMEQPSDEPLQLPEGWPTPRHWLLARQAQRVGLVALEACEAELLELLQQLPLAQALGRLEADVPPAERGLMPERTRAWLARSVRLGVWAGFAPEAA